MGREISLFTSFKNIENRVTNYIGLILKLLYSEDAIIFQNVISQLIDSDQNLIVTPSFVQQKKTGKSIPDLLIFQKSYRLFFETKISDWYYSDQIERQLSDLSKDNQDDKVLFLLSNFDEDNYETRFKEQMVIAKKYGITLQPITFDLLINTIEFECKNLDSSFKQTISEFRKFLEVENLLAKWKHTLDVVNSGKTIEEINLGYYACPDTGGQYSHNRAKFLGPYGNKSVDKIYLIRAVVTIEMGGEKASVKWNNTDVKNHLLEAEAMEKLRNAPFEWRRNEVFQTDMQIFLLADPYPTSFRKSSSGGMFGSKKYFYLPNDLLTPEQVADYLKGKTWEQDLI